MMQSSSQQWTFWERMAESRWGEYLSEMEAAALHEALDRFDGPAASLEVGCEGGDAWFPFSRSSNSSFVPLLVGLERSLGLRRMVRFSPWGAVVAEPLSN